MEVLENKVEKSQNHREGKKKREKVDSPKDNGMREMMNAGWVFPGK